MPHNIQGETYYRAQEAAVAVGVSIKELTDLCKQHQIKIQLAKKNDKKIPLLSEAELARLQSAIKQQVVEVPPVLDEPIEEHQTGVCAEGDDVEKNGEENRHEQRIDKASEKREEATKKTSRVVSVSQLLELNPLEFEQIVVRLLEAMGFSVESTGQTGDGGIDAIACLEAPIVGGTFIVQCKRYSTSNVSVSAVRDLYGVVTDRRAAKGILVTTSSFTQDAMRFAQGKNIDLIDGHALVALLVENGIASVDTLEEIGTEHLSSTDLLVMAVEMGEEKGRQFLAEHGYDVTIEGSQWSITREGPWSVEDMPKDLTPWVGHTNEVLEVLVKCRNSDGHQE